MKGVPSRAWRFSESIRNLKVGFELLDGGMAIGDIDSTELKDSQAPSVSEGQYHLVRPLAHGHTQWPSHSDQQIRNLAPASGIAAAQAVLQVFQQVLSVSFPQLLVLQVGCHSPCPAPCEDQAP